MCIRPLFAPLVIPSSSGIWRSESEMRSLLCFCQLSNSIGGYGRVFVEVSNSQATFENNDREQAKKTNLD